MALSADGTTITGADKVFTAKLDYTSVDAVIKGALANAVVDSDSPNNVIQGPVYDYTSMNKRIRVGSKNTSGAYDFAKLDSIKANNANVYVYDPNRRNNKIEVGDASDVEVDKTLRDSKPVVEVKDKTVAGTSFNNVPAGTLALGLMDYAVGVEYDGDIIDVVIYKAYNFSVNY